MWKKVKDENIKRQGKKKKRVNERGEERIVGRYEVREVHEGGILVAL